MEILYNLRLQIGWLVMKDSPLVLIRKFFDAVLAQVLIVLTTSMVLLLIGLMVLCVVGVVDGPRIINGMFVSRSAMQAEIENQGYSNVHIDRVHRLFPGWHGCTEDDAIAIDAHADNVLGRNVKLHACRGGGLLRGKGMSVRT